MLLQRRTARIWSKACAVLGLGAFIIHAAFALVGRHEFALPLSMLSIVACVYEERICLAKRMAEFGHKRC